MMKKALLLFYLFLILTSCKKQTIAEFDITGSTNVGEQVILLNQSMNATKFSWDFGDGSTSDQNSPTHIYKKPGAYTISLTASGNGRADVNSKQIKIHGTTFSIKNQSSVTLYSFVTFYWDGNDILDYKEYGSLSVGAESETTITTRNQVMYAFEYNSTLYFGEPFDVVQEQHNSFIFNDYSNVYTSGKGAGIFDAKLYRALEEKKSH